MKLDFDTELRIDGQIVSVAFDGVADLDDDGVIVGIQLRAWNPGQRHFRDTVDLDIDTPFYAWLSDTLAAQYATEIKEKVEALHWQRRDATRSYAQIANHVGSPWA